MATRSSKDPIAAWYFNNAEAERVSTDTALVGRLERLYPKKHITIVPEGSCNLLAYAASGNAIITPDNDNITHSGPLAWDLYLPPASRLDGGSGGVGKRVLFGKYKLAWSDYEFILYLVEGRDGGQAYPAIRNIDTPAPFPKTCNFRRRDKRFHAVTVTLNCVPGLNVLAIKRHR